MSERTFDVVTFVGIYDRSQPTNAQTLNSEDIEAIETAMNATVSVAQGASSHGAGFALSIQALQLDVLFFSNRVEVRSLKPTFDKSVAKGMAKFLNEVSHKIVDLHWIRVGYNFILRSDLETTAITKVRDCFFRENLADILGDKVDAVIGGGAWVWLTVGDDTLWLRLQPHRDNPSSKRVVVNANFTVDLESREEFPNPDNISIQLWERWQKIKSVLDGVGI